MAKRDYAKMAKKAASARDIDVWTSNDIVCTCTFCGAHAVVELTERLKKIQPDDTTHVCHPGFGGCNQGFALESK